MFNNIQIHNAVFYTEQTIIISINVVFFYFLHFLFDFCSFFFCILSRIAFVLRCRVVFLFTIGNVSAYRSFFLCRPVVTRLSERAQEYFHVAWMLKIRKIIQIGDLNYFDIIKKLIFFITRYHTGLGLDII